MTLKELIDRANRGYPDCALEEYCDAEGRPQEGPGDTLARFVVGEIADTFDPQAPDEEQLATAARALERAVEDLEATLRALREGPEGERRAVTRTDADTDADADADIPGLLEALRGLQAAGWPLKVYPLDPARPEAGAGALVVCALAGYWTAVSVGDWLSELDRFRAAATLREWLERELDGRDLWGEYLAALYEARWQAGECVEERRATLLGAARAALAAVREAARPCPPPPPARRAE